MPKRKNEEDRICCGLYKHIQLKYPYALLYWWHTPNGGRRTKPQADLFKRMGVLRGVSDYTCSLPSGFYKQLYLEVKTKTGRLEPEQKEFLAAQNDVGHCAVVGWGYDECIMIIDAWMNNEPQIFDWMRDRNLKTERKKFKENGGWC